VLVQAGVSPQGRDFAAANAYAIFSPFSRLAEAQPFAADIRARAARAGRDPRDVKILPGAEFVIADTETQAREKAAHIREQQLTGRTIRVIFEQVWNRDLSDYDIDGPVPDIDPDPDAPTFIQGRAFLYQDRFETVRTWRALAEERSLTLRGLAREVSRVETFAGTPDRVADQLLALVDGGGADGVVLGSHLTPTGLDEFVDRVVPILQERGALRTEYEGTTLRDNLGLPVPVRAAERSAVA